MEDDFLAAFMARAQQRQAKLAQIDTADVNMSSEAPSEAVSYPALSPLPEEEDTTRDEETNTRLGSSELDYSSDLSLSMETDPPSAVFRAEPIICDELQLEQQQQQQQQQLHQQPQQQHQFREPPRPRDQPLRELCPREQNQAEASTLPVERPLFERPQPPCEGPSEFVLRRKSERAEQTKLQLKKLVEVAKYGSKEHIEAAYKLQIADLEHKEYLKRAEMLRKNIPDKTKGLGSIKMSNIKLRISTVLRNDLAQEGVSHHFFCVAILGTEIKPSKIIDTDDIRRQGLKDYLRFREEIEFTDISAKFEIRFEVFELIVGSNSAKFLAKLTPSKKSRPTLESHFKRIGSMRLTLDDSNSSCKNLDQHGEYEKSRYIERSCKFDLEVKPEPLPKKGGMLSVRRLRGSGIPAWRRAWLDLSEGSIKFWNSKQDQLDGRKPNMVIQLRDVCSERVRIINPDEELCRKHSFALYTIQQITSGEGDTIFQRVLRHEPNYKLVFHQFSAGNKHDCDSWVHLLDKSLHCFREWRGQGQIVPLEDIAKIFSGK